MSGEANLRVASGAGDDALSVQLSGAWALWTSRPPASLIATLLLLGWMGQTALAMDAQSVALNVSGVSMFASGADLLNFGFGSFDVARERGGQVHAGTSGAAQIEYRIGRKLFIAGPLLGLIATGEGGVMGYGGVYMDAALDRFRRWRFSPVLSLGGYDEGDGKRLGGVFEFHVGASLTYMLDSGARFGLAVTHISNAFIHKDNPGAEIILLSYMIPFDGVTSVRGYGEFAGEVK